MDFLANRFQNPPNVPNLDSIEVMARHILAFESHGAVGTKLLEIRHRGRSKKPKDCLQASLAAKRKKQNRPRRHYRMTIKIPRS